MLHHPVVQEKRINEGKEKTAADRESETERKSKKKKRYEQREKTECVQMCKALKNEEVEVRSKTFCMIRFSINDNKLSN